MQRTINFLAARTKTISQQQLRDRKLFRVVGLILGGVCACGVILFGAYFAVGLHDRGLEAQAAEVRSQILGNQKNEETYTVYAKKLSTLATLYKSRQDKNAIMTYFSQLFGESVVISGIQYGQADQMLRFQVQTDDVFAFRAVLAKVNSPDVKTVFPSLTTSDLTRSQDATYVLTLSVPVSRQTASASASSVPVGATGGK